VAVTAPGPRPRPSAPLLALVALGEVFAAIVFALIAGSAAVAGKPTGMLVVLGLFVPFVVYRRPHLGIAGLFGAALALEQSPVAGVSGLVTDHIPFFSAASQGSHGNFADIMVIVLAVPLVVRVVGTGRDFARGPLGYAVIGLVAAALWGVFIGLAHGGDQRVALMEVRPYVYLASAFAFSAAFLTTRRLIRAVLWVIVLVTAAKGAQAIFAFIQVRSMDPRPEAVLGHEQSFLFGVYVAVVLGLWLLDERTRLRTVATWLLPVVLLGDMVNSRRVAWLILAAVVIVVSVIAAVHVPRRRGFLRKALVVAAVFNAIYLPAFWNKTGTLGQPARAVHSFVSPDQRDALSNLYRIQENANLVANIQASGPLGKGFGTRIDYVLPITDISDLDPLIAYIPHNGVLYVVMRMGILGAILFWTFIGVAIVAGCRLARSRDPDVALIGLVVPAACVAYALQGYNDQGFFFYRIAICLGVLLGLVESAARLRDAQSPPEEVAT
jgi:hypothetical protein